MIVDERGVLSIRLWILCTKDCDSGIWEPVATQPDPVVNDGSDLDDENGSDESPAPELPKEEPKIVPFNNEAFIQHTKKVLTCFKNNMGWDFTLIL